MVELLNINKELLLTTLHHECKKYKRHPYNFKLMLITLSMVYEKKFVRGYIKGIKWKRTLLQGIFHKSMIKCIIMSINEFVRWNIYIYPSSIFRLQIQINSLF